MDVGSVGVDEEVSRDVLTVRVLLEEKNKALVANI